MWYQFNWWAFHPGLIIELLFLSRYIYMETANRLYNLNVSTKLHHMLIWIATYHVFGIRPRNHQRQDRSYWTSYMAKSHSKIGKIIFIVWCSICICYHKTAGSAVTVLGSTAGGDKVLQVVISKEKKQQQMLKNKTWAEEMLVLLVTCSAACFGGIAAKFNALVSLSVKWGKWPLSLCAEHLVYTQWQVIFCTAKHCY